MPVETTAEIDQLTAVESETGDFERAANEAQQQRLNDRTGNFPGGVDGATEDDGTGSALPEREVPHGVTVLVQAQHSNAERVRVGLTDSPTVELPAGSSIEYRPRDLSQIRVEAKTAGDGVNFTAEVS